MGNSIADDAGRIRPAVKLVLAAVIPRIHQSIEARIDGRHDGVIGQETVVGRRDEVAIRPFEDVDVADFDHVGAGIAADRLDHALRSQIIDAARPADQELADVVGGDRVLLSRSDFESRSSEASR